MKTKFQTTNDIKVSDDLYIQKYSYNLYIISFNLT